MSRPVRRSSTPCTSTTGSARAFTYDAAGNIATDSRTGALGMTYQYDPEGRLSKVFQTNATANGATYLYDANSRLSQRIVTQSVAPTSTTTVYVHDLNDHIIAELNASGQTLREYIWLDDMPVAVVDNVLSGSPVIYFVHVDHLMRPARMTAAGTNWVWDVIYAPFGAVSYIWTNPETMDIRFPGQWFQLESGLAYNWHRHYDATLGRYVQPDPMGLPALLSDGPSVYGYARLNPTTRTDYSGLLSAGRPPEVSLPTELCSKKKPTFWCQNVICGAPHGGLFCSLCPDCYSKLQNGTPTLLENGELLLPPAPPPPPAETP